MKVTPANFMAEPTLDMVLTADGLKDQGETAFDATIEFLATQRQGPGKPVTSWLNKSLYAKVSSACNQAEDT